MTTPPDPPLVAPSAGRLYRVWRIARYLFGLGAAGVAAWLVAGKTDELHGVTAYLGALRWWWLAVAVAAEGVSYVAYAALQKRLLASGKVRVRMLPLTGISLASIAMENSLPGGLLFYAAYLFRQYRRFGADDVLAAWTLIALNVVSFITLSVIASFGLAMALGAATAYDLVEVILAITMTSMLIVVAWAERALLLPHLARAVRVSQFLLRRPSRARSAEHHIQLWLDRLVAVSPTRTDWAHTVTLSLANWVADCACLALSFMAVGAGVPWRGLLLAYGAGQLATVLPITPGGLGVVEGSLTVALVTFGGAQSSTVAAVLIYRLISFWLILPVGWGSWGALSLAGRNRRRGSTAVVEAKAA